MSNPLTTHYGATAVEIAGQDVRLRLIEWSEDEAQSEDELVQSSGPFVDELDAGFPASWCRSTSKRTIDVAICLLIMPFAVPLIAGLGAVSAIVFRCNPLFVQDRRGLDGAALRIVKIRSLPKSFPHRQAKHHLPKLPFRGWSRLLRASHLDELPQLFNVLAGSMAVVGPRPMIDEVLDELEPTDRQLRSTVKPGLAGPWQISTMGAEPLHDCPELDHRYVMSATIGADLRMIWWTLMVTIGRPAPSPEELIKRLGW